MNTPIIKRVTQRLVELDESQRAALSAANQSAASSLSPSLLPLLLPLLLIDAEIVSNACDGVWLHYRAADGSFSRALAHRSVAEAEQTAQTQFGIRRDEWQAGELPSAPARPTTDRAPLPRRS